MSDILLDHLYGKETLQDVKGAAYAAGGGSVLKTPPNSIKRAYDPLTYEELRSFDFDANAKVLYGMDHLLN